MRIQTLSAWSGEGSRVRAISLKTMAVILSLCLLRAPACAQSDQVQKAPERELPEIVVQTKDALTLLSGEKESEARAALNKSIATARRNGEVDVPALYMLALMDYSNYRISSAMRSLKKIEQYYSKAPKVSAREKMLLHKRMAQCYYRDRDYLEAADQYKVALEDSTNTPEDARARVEILEGLVGSLWTERQLADAQRYCQMLTEETRQHAMSGNLLYAGSHLWSLLLLVEILEKRGDTAQLAQARADAAGLLEKLIELRKDLETRGVITPSATARGELLSLYIKDSRPASTTDYLWLAVDFEPKTLPLVSWSQGTPKAAIICIHGMGLENRAFTFFGQEMARRGYAVYSLDVRGFGAWKAIKGHEDTAYSATLNDIKRVANFIRRRNPGLPIFVLGESMGGAIALRAAALYGDTMDGVIASVPSAERFQNQVMGFKVALNLLAGGLNKPFDIGGQIESQATKRSELLQLWHGDVKAKARMSPKELIKFAAFMRLTLRHCREITKTPAIIVQGLADRLVKPEGTFDMFKAIPNQDRTLVIVGDAEHLIFETDKQDVVLLQSISAWIDKHVASRGTEPKALTFTRPD